MYPNSPLLWLPVITTHLHDGNFAVVEIRDDDETFNAQQRERLLKAHPELTHEEVEKIILLQERMANTIFDIWLTKRNKKTA